MKTQTSKRRIFISTILLIPISAILFFSFADREYVERENAEFQKQFENELENWEEENRFLQKPYLGILDTPLSCYSNTVGLRVKIQTNKVGLVPDISLDETNHPLFFEQENGILYSRVIEFAKMILYNH